MVNHSIEKQVEEFLYKELPVVTTIFLKKVEVDETEALQDVYETEDIIAMLEKYFQLFEVKHESFVPDNYFPWKKRHVFSGKKTRGEKKKLTRQMLIDSARAKVWLYE